MKDYYTSFIEKCSNKIKKKVGFVILNIKKKALNLRIGTKFILFYLILIILSTWLSNLLFQRINYRILENKIGDVSVQNLNTISSSVDSLIGNVNNYSKMILSNENIQGTLANKSEYMDVGMSRTIGTLLAGYMEAMPNISSIYLFDNNSTKYAVDRRSSVKSLKYENINQASWYNEAVEKKGKYIIKLNAGGIFEDGHEEKNISFIRMINDVKFNKPIGFLMINIPIDVFKATYNKAITGNNVYIAICDKGDTIIDFDNPKYKIGEMINDINVKDSKSKIFKIGKESFLVSFITSQQSNFSFVSMMPFNQVMSESKQLDFIPVFIILLNGVFIFIGSIFISRLITTPIKRLIASMKKVEKGEFTEVHIRSGNDEIGELRDGYNVMVVEIGNLIQKIMAEQKIKRRAELNVLQEQIKPHFLYNSLDAIAYMALAGKGEEAYNVIIALSNYYRTSLSKGSEVITIAEEVEIVRNYLTIQKVRFPNMFIDEYEIDESIGAVKIVKLILQPLVENGLYHGIRPKGESGKIKVTVKREDKWIKITVEDDGVGMSKDELNKVKSSELGANLSSFGLRGTIERLKIFYGTEDIYDISSEEGYGTKISITIPIN